MTGNTGVFESVGNHPLVSVCLPHCKTLGCWETVVFSCWGDREWSLHGEKMEQPADKGC